MSETPKLCKDCRWFNAEMGGTCERPNRPISLVTGEPALIGAGLDRSCFSSPTTCGVSGQFFEPITEVANV